VVPYSGGIYDDYRPLLAHAKASRPGALHQYLRNKFDAATLEIHPKGFTFIGGAAPRIFLVDAQKKMMHAFLYLEFYRFLF
jgi:hypothetical protein